MQKSPEALRIYFSGTQAAKALAEGNFTAEEARIIEAAMATARTPNPDLDLLREADAVLHRTVPDASEMRHGTRPGERRSYHESSLAQLSKEMEIPESSDTVPHSFLGYVIWRWERRWRWRHIYAPIITLVLILLTSLIVTRCSFVQDRLKASPKLSIINFTRFDEAQKRCEKIGQKLAATPKEILERIGSLDEIEAEWGYWLRDGRVFVPKSYQTLPADNRMHGFVCVPE